MPKLTTKRFRSIIKKHNIRISSLGKTILNIDELLDCTSWKDCPNTKLKCSCGDISERGTDALSLRNIKSNKCQKCYEPHKEKFSDEEKLQREDFIKHKCKEMEASYKGVERKTRNDGRKRDFYTFVCKSGNTHYKSYHWFKCYSHCQCLERRDTEKMRDYFNKYDKTLLLYEHGGNTTKKSFVKIGCDKCKKEIRRQYQTLYNYPFCPYCEKTPMRSANEQYLYNIIDKDYGKEYNLEANNRKILNPLELDIVVSKGDDVVLCIEWNGVYWHSKQVERDELKEKKLKELNIPFIQVSDPDRYDPYFVERTYKEKIKPTLDKFYSGL
jgi:hypothetical protein